MSDEPKRPYYIPKEQHEQNKVLRAMAELVRQLGNAAPKIDHTCKVVKRNDN